MISFLSKGLLNGLAYGKMRAAYNPRVWELFGSQGNHGSAEEV